MIIDNSFRENFYNYDNDINFVIEWNELLKKWKSFNDLEEYPQLFGVFKRKQTILYFGSISKNGFLALNDEIQSFLGYYVNPEPSQLDENDYHECLLSNIFYNSISFKIIVNETTVGLKEKIDLYFKLLAERPKTKTKLVLPFGQIRNLFDQAILSGDEVNAEKYKLEMIENNNDTRLTPRNDLFLNIRMKAGLQLWDKFNLNDLRKLKDYKDQIPLIIIKDISKYFYFKGIVEYIDSCDFEACKKHLNDHLCFNEFLTLFSTRFSSDDKILLHVTIFSELAKEKVNWEYVSYLYGQFRSGDLTNLIKKVYENISSSNIEETSNFFEEASDAFFNDENYDLAFHLFLKCELDAKLLSNLIKCLKLKFVGNIEDWSTEVGYDSKQVEQIINVFKNLNDSEKEKFKENQHHYNLYQKIVGSLNNFPKECNSWSQWINLFKDNQEIESLIILLKENGGSWDLNDFKIQPTLLVSLSNILYNMENFAEVQNILYEIFVKDTEKVDQIFINFLNSLFELILFKPVISDYDLEFCNDIQLIILKSERTESQYSQLVESCLEIDEKFIGLNNFDLILDITEKFMNYPYLNQNKLFQFFNKVISLGLKYNKLLKDSQRELLKTLLDENFPDQTNNFNIETQLQEEENINDLSFLENKTLAIYTLVDGVGSRVTNFIKSRISSCNITINSNHECTHQLKALAANSDFFVFAWKASKHQAFFCITNERKQDELIRPLGKGSSSIIRSLIEYNNT